MAEENYSIKSAEFDGCGGGGSGNSTGKFYLEFFVVTGKLVLHCTGDDERFCYKLSCAQFDFAASSDDLVNSKRKSVKHTLPNYEHTLFMNLKKELEIKFWSWTNCKKLNIEVDDDNDLDFDTLYFNMYGMKFCLVYCQSAKN